MKRLAIVALLLCGCMSTQKGVDYPSAVTAQMAVKSAAGSTRKAARNTVSAKEALRVAAAKSHELLVLANPVERPIVVQLQTALETTQTELEQAQTELDSANGSLAESSGALDGLQKQIREMGSALTQAQEEADRMKAARDFWRACVWKLALLSLALGVWAFRKPLLAIAGL